MDLTWGFNLSSKHTEYTTTAHNIKWPYRKMTLRRSHWGHVRDCLWYVECRKCHPWSNSYMFNHNLLEWIIIPKNLYRAFHIQFVLQKQLFKKMGNKHLFLEILGASPVTIKNNLINHILFTLSPITDFPCIIIQYFKIKQPAICFLLEGKSSHVPAIFFCWTLPD